MRTPHPPRHLARILKMRALTLTCASWSAFPHLWASTPGGTVAVVRAAGDAHARRGSTSGQPVTMMLQASPAHLRCGDSVGHSPHLRPTPAKRSGGSSPRAIAEPDIRGSFRGHQVSSPMTLHRNCHSALRFLVDAPSPAIAGPTPAITPRPRLTPRPASSPAVEHGRIIRRERGTRCFRFYVIR